MIMPAAGIASGGRPPDGTNHLVLDWYSGDMDFKVAGTRRCEHSSSDGY